LTNEALDRNQKLIKMRYDILRELQLATIRFLQWREYVQQSGDFFEKRSRKQMRAAIKAGASKRQWLLEVKERLQKVNDVLESKEAQGLRRNALEFVKAVEEAVKHNESELEYVMTFKKRESVSQTPRQRVKRGKKTGALARPIPLDSPTKTVIKVVPPPCSAKDAHSEHSEG
jgi:hypothetical protein